jgi:hypothetical protein
MARAFKFLKRTSLSVGAPGEGAGVTEADNGGVVLIGEALVEAALIGAAGGGVSSWPVTNETAQIESNERQNRIRAVISMSSENDG